MLLSSLLTEVAISSVSSFLAGKCSMTHSPRNVLLFSNIRTPLALITRLLTGRADIPVISTAQIKIPSDIKYYKLNMITHRNST